MESALTGAPMLERRGSHLESGVFAQQIYKDDIPSMQQGQYATLTIEMATPDGMQAVEQLILSATGDAGIVETVTQPVVAEDANTYNVVYDGASGEYVSPEELALREALRQPGEIFGPPIETAPTTSSLLPAESAGSTDSPGAQPEGSTSEEELPPEGCETIEAWMYVPEFDAWGPVLMHWNGWEYEGLG